MIRIRYQTKCWPRLIKLIAGAEKSQPIEKFYLQELGSTLLIDNLALTLKHKGIRWKIILHDKVRLLWQFITVCFGRIKMVSTI